MNVAQHCGTSESNCSVLALVDCMLHIQALSQFFLFKGIKVQAPSCPHFLFLPLHLPWCPINSLRGVTVWSGWPFSPRLTIQFSYHLCHLILPDFCTLSSAIPYHFTSYKWWLHLWYTHTDVKSWSVNILILSMYCVTSWYRGAWHWILVAVHLPSGK